MDKRDILLIHGTDYKEMTKRLLEQADLAADIGDRQKKIALKPNLVTSSPPSQGATTHGELLAGAIEYLQEHGVLFAPGKAANAGGVATSALEMSQNSERLSWSYEEVDAKLKDIMVNICHNMADAAKRYGA